MKSFFKPARLGFYFLMLLAFFMLGLYYASWVDAGKDQGLAGGAIVLGYGISFGGLALLVSFFIAFYLPISSLKKINWGLLVFFLATIAYTYLRFKGEDKKQKMPNAKTARVTSESGDIAMIHTPDSSNQNIEMGIGIFKPQLFQGGTLLFYGGVTLDKGIGEHQAQDSLVVSLDAYGTYTTTYAPPYLWPEAMQIEYGLFYFKILSTSYDLIEVEVNSKTGQTAYFKKQSGELLYWPEFLMRLNEIRFRESVPKNIHIKPLPFASKVSTSWTFLRPLEVQSEWMQVSLLNDSRQKVDSGWIQWRKGEQFLIDFEIIN